MFHRQCSGWLSKVFSREWSARKIQGCYQSFLERRRAAFLLKVGRVQETHRLRQNKRFHVHELTYLTEGAAHAIQVRAV